MGPNHTLTCDELHAVAEGIGAARGLAFPQDAHHNDPMLMIVRAEARRVVYALRERQLPLPELEHAARTAVLGLLYRMGKGQPCAT